MAELNEVPKTKIVNRYPPEGPLKAITIAFEGYWARFVKSPDGQKVVWQAKGETRNSKAFNVSIPAPIYLKMYRRALCEFKPAKADKPAQVAKPVKQEVAVTFCEPEKFAIVPVVPIRHQPPIFQARLF